ncbi:MAG: hypothetical protein JWO48_3134 [Bryobacterales bacterium]|nr:hypothetical protein [Bryobacterales bacterium]
MKFILSSGRRNLVPLPVINPILNFSEVNECW